MTVDGEDSILGNIVTNLYVQQTKRKNTIDLAIVYLTILCQLLRVM